MRMRRFSAACATSACAAATSSVRSSVRGSRSTWPDSMRARSSVSLIMCSRCQPAWRICAVQSSWCGASGCLRSSSSSCVKPSSALSGVRSSWLMRDRNSLLARLAASAPSRARCASSSARCSVMSSITQTMRRGSLSLPPRSALTLARVAMSRPSEALQRRWARAIGTSPDNSRARACDSASRSSACSRRDIGMPARRSLVVPSSSRR